MYPEKALQLTIGSFVKMNKMTIRIQHIIKMHHIFVWTLHHIKRSIRLEIFNQPENLLMLLKGYTLYYVTMTKYRQRSAAFNCTSDPLLKQLSKTGFLEKRITDKLIVCAKDSFKMWQICLFCVPSIDITPYLVQIYWTFIIKMHINCHGPSKSMILYVGSSANMVSRRLRLVGQLSNWEGVNFGPPMLRIFRMGVSPLHINFSNILSTLI